MSQDEPALDLDNVEWESDAEEGVDEEDLFTKRLEEQLDAQKALNQSSSSAENQVSSSSSLDQLINETRAKKQALELRRKAKFERRRQLQLKLSNLKATLLGRLAICLNVNNQISSWTEQVLSLLPTDLKQMMHCNRSVGSVQACLSWLRRTFRRRPTSSLTQVQVLDPSVLSSKEGSEWAICQLLACATRAHEIPTRLIVRLTQEVALQESDVWCEFYLEDSVWYRAFGTITRIAEAEQQERIWGKARTVDPQRKRTNHAGLECLPRRTDDSKTLVCVIGLSDGNDISVVTKRYSSRPVKANPVINLLQQVISDWNTSLVDIPSYVQESISDESKVKEDSSVPIETSVPTTLEGFKKSSEFVLESNMSMHQSPREGSKPVNFFRGQAVYRSSEVDRLHNEFGWKKLGRKVKADELDNPKQILPKRTKIDMSSNFKSDAASETKALSPEKERSNGTTDSNVSPWKKDENEEELVDPRRKLYDESQTDPIDPGEVDEVNLSIPSNEYGNVELFHEKSLPRGAMHLALNHADAACKHLNIPFAPAVIGFEWRDGRTRPKFCGIVLATRMELAVREQALLIAEQVKMDEENKARKQRAQLWRDLLEANWLVMQSSATQSEPKSKKATSPTTTTTTTTSNGDGMKASVEEELVRLGKRTKVDICEEHEFVNGRCIKCRREEADVEYF